MCKRCDVLYDTIKLMETCLVSINEALDAGDMESARYLIASGLNFASNTKSVLYYVKEEDDA